jgi:hypothetical protein
MDYNAQASEPTTVPRRDLPRERPSPPTASVGGRWSCGIAGGMARAKESFSTTPSASWLRLFRMSIIFHLAKAITMREPIQPS